jgi:arylsulfatase
MTAWIGKNHNTPVWEASAVGPFDSWANGLGFDYFYGFNGGDIVDPKCAGCRMDSQRGCVS